MRFEAPDGGIDMDTIRHAIESLLHQVPRFRQKLAWIPIEGHPVWVDDAAFDLDYHVRHTRLPAPGTLDELKATSARIRARSANARSAIDTTASAGWAGANRTPLRFM